MLKPAACRFDWTRCASDPNGTPLIVRSLGYSSVIVLLPAPDAASSVLALVRFCLIASLRGREPRNIDGMIPGAWIAPGPATLTIER